MELNLTIVIPVYNEEESLEYCFRALDSYVTQVCFLTKVIFVDDGSTDSSLVLIKNWCLNSPLYNYLSLDKNYGLSTALKAGIDSCATSYVGYMDADLQTTPMDFNLLTKYLPAYDMVIGIRTDRKDTLIKRMSSLIANRVRRFLIADGITDTGCPLKVMKLEIAQNMPFFKGMHRFLPALVQLQHGTIKQVPVRHFPRVAGQAKYGLSNRLFKPLIDTFAFRWLKSRYVDYHIISKGANFIKSHELELR